MSEAKQNFQEAEMGGLVQWGMYQGEKTMWRVLEKQNQKMLLISEKCIDVQPFDLDWENTTWETCSLRQWLNGEFLQQAFSESEQKDIVPVVNQNDNNPVYRTPGGKETEDKIFLLSVQEADKYFPTDDERRAMASDYAKSQKIYVDKEGFTWWWLRTMGFVSNCGTEIKNDGSIDFIGRLGDITGCGNGTSSVTNGIRPALWVSIGE